MSGLCLKLSSLFPLSWTQTWRLYSQLQGPAWFINPFSLSLPHLFCSNPSGSSNIHQAPVFTLTAFLLRALSPPPPPGWPMVNSITSSSQRKLLSPPHATLISLISFSTSSHFWCSKLLPIYRFNVCHFSFVLSLDCKYYECGHFAFCVILYPKYLEQRPAQRRCVIKIC